MKKFQFQTNNQWHKKILDFLKKIIPGIIILGVTLILCFFILEKYFAYYYSQAKNTPQTAMNLPIYQESEYRSWDHKPNSEAEHGWGIPTPKIKINSIGLRNEEIPQEKTRTRYLLLGDSFTFGMGVDQDQSFPQVLQKILGEKFHRVINAGIIGQTVDDALMYLKYEGIKLRPDFVIYNFFVGNDITELRRHDWEKDEKENVIRVKDKLLHVDEQNRLRQKEQKEPSSYFLFWLSERWQILKQKYSSSESIDPTLTWPIFLSENHPLQDPEISEYLWKAKWFLTQMKDFCDKNGIVFIVNVIPMDVQVSKDYWKKYPGTPFDNEAFEMQRPQEWIKILGEKQNIPVWDFLPILQEEEKINGNMYFEEDPHFNVKGHKFFASYLWKFLMDNYLQ